MMRLEAIVGTLLLSTLLCACAQNPSPKAQPATVPNFTQAYLDSLEYAVENAEEALQAVQHQELELYSPQTFAQAQSQLKRASQSLDKQQGITWAQDIGTLITKAQDNKKNTLRVLKQPFAENQHLLSIRSDKAAPYAINRSRRSFKD